MIFNNIGVFNGVLYSREFNVLLSFCCVIMIVYLTVYVLSGLFAWCSWCSRWWWCLVSLPENYAQNSELTGCIMMPWFGPKLIFVFVGNKEFEPK